jgi:PAS domain-containing protein
MLLRNACDVDAIDKAGMSSLHMAARQAHVDTIQLLLRHGANPFLSVKRGIFKGRLAIDFVITAKSKDATSLLLLAMQKPQGWPIADVRKFVEAALASFRGLPPAGAPKPRKADLSAIASSPQLGPARASPHIGPNRSSPTVPPALVPQMKLAVALSKPELPHFASTDRVYELDESEQELLKLMDESTSPIFIKDGLGHYLYSSHSLLPCCCPALDTLRMYCNDEMLRIIGRTIEHVIGRSSEQLEGVEANANIVGGSEGDDRMAKDDDQQQVYMLDIIDASGFLHKGSALSNSFQLAPSDRRCYLYVVFLSIYQCMLFV